MECPEESHNVGLLINSPPGLYLAEMGRFAFYSVIRFIERSGLQVLKPLAFMCLECIKRFRNRYRRIRFGSCLGLVDTSANESRIAVTLSRGDLSECGNRGLSDGQSESW